MFLEERLHQAALFDFLLAVASVLKITCFNLQILYLEILKIELFKLKHDFLKFDRHI